MQRSSRSSCDDLRRWGERIGILRGVPAGAGDDRELRAAVALLEPPLVLHARVRNPGEDRARRNRS